MPNYIRVKQIDQPELTGFFVDSISSQSGLLINIASGVVANQAVLSTGNQTISGVKTFNLQPILSGNPLITGDLSVYATTSNLALTGSGLNFSKQNHIIEDRSVLLNGFIFNSLDEGRNVRYNITFDGATTSYNLNLPSTGQTGDKFYLSATTPSNTTLNINRVVPGPPGYTLIETVSSGTIFNKGYYINQFINGTIANFVSMNTLMGFSSTTGLDSTGSRLQTNINNLSSYTVFTTGDQTISGIKTFATRIITSGNLQVSGTGIFNAIDLNNIDNLSLSGVDVTITSGVVSLTNRPTVNGTGVLLSGEAGAAILSDTIVYNTGNQNISGFKTFAAAGNNIIISGTSDSEGIIKSLSSNLTIEGANSTYGIRFSDEGTFIHGYTEINNDLFAQTGTFQKLYADNLVYNTGNQNISGGNLRVENNVQVSGTGIFNALDLNNIDNLSLSGVDITIQNATVDLGNSKLINAVPGFINETTNFIISGNDNGRVILANHSTNEITGTIVSGNAIGFNTSIIQINSGIFITGSGNGITINSFGGYYRTAGKFATISLLHTGNNGYIMYGNAI